MFIQSVLTIGATLAELLAEVVSLRTGAGVVAGLSGVVARRVVIHVIVDALSLLLDLTAVHRPQPNKGMALITFVY